MEKELVAVEGRLHPVGVLLHPTMGITTSTCAARQAVARSGRLIPAPVASDLALGVGGSSACNGAASKLQRAVASVHHKSLVEGAVN